MSIPIREVPIALRRRGAQHLESLRGSELGRKAEGLTLGPTAWPMYRPDVAGVAYYELALVRAGGQPGGVVTTRAWPAGRTPAPIVLQPLRPQEITSVGFVIVSTGPHDAPIPHWSLERPAPSAQLEMSAGGKRPTRILRLDALSYVAEDETGGMASHLGPLPLLPDGLPHDLARSRGLITSATARPSGTVADDSKIAGVEHRAQAPVPPAAIAWIKSDDWKEYHTRYADAFGPALDAHRRKVAPTWAHEAALEEFGEGIHPGEPFTVALLDPGAAIELSGPGAELVEVHVLEGVGRAAVELRAKAPPGLGEVDFQMHITHATGEAENLHFFIVARDSPSNAKTPSPMGTAGGEP